jgi:hypothetical protein
LSLPPYFIGFHEDRLGGTIPQQSTGKFPLVFLLKKLFEMDCFRDGLCPWNSRFFNPIWIGLLQFNKVFKGKPFISRPISSLLTLRKNWRLFVFNTIVYNWPYTARPSCKHY